MDCFQQVEGLDTNLYQRAFIAVIRTACVGTWGFAPDYGSADLQSILGASPWAGIGRTFGAFEFVAWGERSPVGRILEDRQFRDAESMVCEDQSVPQRLKPQKNIADYGTAKAVPLSKAE